MFRVACNASCGCLRHCVPPHSSDSLPSRTPIGLRPRRHLGHHPRRNTPSLFHSARLPPLRDAPRGSDTSPHSTASASRTSVAVSCSPRTLSSSRDCAGRSPGASPWGPRPWCLPALARPAPSEETQPGGRPTGVQAAAGEGSLSGTYGPLRPEGSVGAAPQGRAAGCRVTESWEGDGGSPVLVGSKREAPTRPRPLALPRAVYHHRGPSRRGTPVVGRGRQRLMQDGICPQDEKSVVS